MGGARERGRKGGKKEGRREGGEQRVKTRGIETRGTPVTTPLIPIEAEFHLAGQESERSFAKVIRHRVQAPPYSTRVRP